MIRKRATDDPDVVLVEFVVDHAPARPVALVGSFNDWDAEACQLEETEDGVLGTTLKLPAGERFEFRYRDGRGRWFNDEAADDYVDNTQGETNGVFFT